MGILSRLIPIDEDPKSFFDVSIKNAEDIKFEATTNLEVVDNKVVLKRLANIFKSDSKINMIHPYRVLPVSDNETK